MPNWRTRAPAFAACALLCAGSALALDSASASFRDGRSSVDSGGVRKLSAAFRSDASAGLLSSTGVSSSFRNRGGFRSMAYQPARIADLRASSTPFTTALALQWTAPGNDGDEATSAGAFVLKYSSVPADAPAQSQAKFDAADAIPVPPPPPGLRGTLHTLMVTGLAPGVTYYFAIETSERDGVRSLFSAVAFAQTSSGAGASANVRPQEPYGVALSSTAATVTLRWMPVARFADMTPFAAPSAPQPTELTAYHVYRATTPVQAVWADVSAALSTGTVTWTDPAGGPQYYYHVRAENTYGLSDRSVVRTGGNRAAYVVAPDDMSYFEVLEPQLFPIEGVAADPDSAYLITVSSHPEDLGTENGRVVKSLEFKAYRGGRLLASDFSIADHGVLHMHYDLASNGAVTPSGLSASGIAPTPGNMSVYWNNGRRWEQMYGRLDASARIMSLETRYTGRYQLRLVERAGGFAFNTAGLSNRFLTPNGDGKNDDVVFTFDNPRDSAVSGRIIDRQGRVVVGSLPSGPVGNSLLWDGRAGGRSVPGGVYIYQLQGEGQTFSGTVVVIR